MMNNNSKFIYADNFLSSPFNIDGTPKSHPMSNFAKY